LSLTLANILGPDSFQIFKVWIEQSVSHACSSVHVFVDRPLPLRHRLERLTTVRANSRLLGHVSLIEQSRDLRVSCSWDRVLRLSCRTAIWYNSNRCIYCRPNYPDKSILYDPGLSLSSLMQDRRLCLSVYSFRSPLRLHGSHREVGKSNDSILFRVHW
jgi:hypothetical protein